MLSLETPSLLGVASGLPAPPSRSETAAPRAVEAGENGKSDSGVSEKGYSPSRAVLQLLRRSAESFADILISTKNVGTAAAMSGTPPPEMSVGSHVDTYA